MMPPQSQAHARLARACQLFSNRATTRPIVIAAIIILAFSTIWLSRDLISQGSSTAFVTSFRDRLKGYPSQDAPLRSTPHLIPPKIWEIMLSKKGVDPKAPVKIEVVNDARSWLSLNRDYEFTLVGSAGAQGFLQRYYAKAQPEVVQVFNDFVNVGMKSDLLRYLILDKIGGVYTDTDTVARRPIDDWVPRELRDKVRVIVGIEWDQQDRGAVDTIPHIVQFCQWTIAAAPGHPVFGRMVKRVLGAVKDLESRHGKPLAQIQPEYFDVLNTTGPAMWTDAVFEQLQVFDPTLNTTKDFSYLKESRLVGDMLVLPINGFGMGQGHSGSVHDGTIPEEALVSHHFHGSWKEPKKEEPKKEEPKKEEPKKEEPKKEDPKKEEPKKEEGEKGN